MSYITNEDIAVRLGGQTLVQLTDDDGDGVADVGVIDEARLAAVGEVDSHLARRYRTPIHTAAHPELGPLLAAVSLDLVEQRLRARRPPVATEVGQRAEAARHWLQQVAAGGVDLPASATLQSTTLRGPLGKVTGADRLISRDEMSDY